MRILYVHPGPYPPDLYAGSELAMDWLCRTLKARGHEVAVVATTRTPEDDFTVSGEYGGYPIVRTQKAIRVTRVMIRKFRPDAIVVSHSGEWLTYLLRVIGDLPLFVYEHEVGDGIEGSPPQLRRRASFIANSEATQAHLLRAYGLASTVVRPLFGVDRYAHVKPKGKKTLFVSLQPRKGSDVAVAIARARPKHKFVFVESWTRWPERTEILRGIVGAMPNVTLLPNRPDIDDVLAETKLLLMPSRGQESWGRTATEAQMCGIPVLGSSRGNLTRTIGPGGVTFDPDEPIERWLAAFDSIMNDPARYEDLSKKALAHGTAMKAEIERNYRVFETLMAGAAERRRA